jgi:hypothetical protein
MLLTGINDGMPKGGIMSLERDDARCIDPVATHDAALVGFTIILKVPLT